MQEMAKVYEPGQVEALAERIWQEGRYGCADATGGGQKDSFTIVIPPPNVTAALHLGHALNNTLQDILIRMRRMQGFNTLWMPGTDHAGIATQTVVDKRLKAEGKPSLVDYKQLEREGERGRSQFLEKVQSWKDEYEARILGQLKKMGCSCDWDRTRFTMDEVCAKAVRTNFFNLFKDDLIYRGKRLVNWDPATQTVLADDEVEHQNVQGFFWYLKYPLEAPVECSTGVPPVSNNSTGKMPVIREHTGVAPVEAAVHKREGARLPHWTKEGAIYAVSFRLADSVPAHILEGWRLERQSILQRAEDQKRELTDFERKELERLYSERIESYLDAGRGECVLHDRRAAEIATKALNHFDGQRYDLIAWAVMPNHIHVIVKPCEGNELSEILHSWKSFTAKEINKAIGREGKLWMPEYYDHLIRDEEDLWNQITYVLKNPSKADLRDWPWVGGGTTFQAVNEAADLTHGQDARDTNTGKMPVIRIEHVTVATTRPETMLGDTAVAINPNDPRAKYLVGKMVRLPIVGRLIPIVADEHVVLPDPDSADEKARFSTGFLKVTPAHDPNDWEIGQRHNLDVINVMAPDGTISDRHGWQDVGEDAQFLLGMDRFEAREAIVEWFRQEKLLEQVRDYAHEVGHSYRSHVPIEPYLSDQWYVAVKKPIDNVKCQMSNVKCQTHTLDGVVYLKDTDVPVNSLAGLALVPLLEGRLKFHPERYSKTYQTWLENLRDWPISRQLWWGHQIPVWKSQILAGFLEPEGDFNSFLQTLDDWAKQGRIAVKGRPRIGFGHRDIEEEYPAWFICVYQPDDTEVVTAIESRGFTRDDDVLDTWFSSALWPFSTLGWPDATDELKTFYPTDVLCTAREIITLWVSRMVMMGQYCLGDIPFSDVYIHAMIQDGQGRKMSKSLGNGIDPLVAIDSHGADAMRFTLASMTTDTQDVRMPVAPLTLPDGRTVNTSPKFDVGRSFCNKLWNASRFAMMNLAGNDPAAFDANNMDITDRWILSRLGRTIRAVTEAIDGYKFNEPINELYRFFWNDFCDWYLEWSKPRMQDAAQKPIAQNVLAFVLDQVLRLLHPFMPFITEGIYQNLNAVVPRRGLNGIAQPAVGEALMIAPWPERLDEPIDEACEREIDLIQHVIRSIRDVRSQYTIAPSRLLTVSAAAPEAVCAMLAEHSELISQLAGAEALHIAPGLEKPANAAAAIVEDVQIYVHDVIDPEAERQRLQKQKDFIEKGLRPLQAKLNNENFVSRAKPEVVAQSRQKLKELTDQLEAVEKHLAELKP